MKKIVSRFSLVFGPVIFAASLFVVLTSGCRTVSPTQPQSAPPGPPTSMPSAGILGIHPGTSAGNSADFALDLFVVDSSGHAISNLASDAISITSSLDTLFTQSGITTSATNPFGYYSAELLLDQTGSIRKTDPLNLRLIAANLFLKATALLPAPNEIQLSTFQDSLHQGEYLHTYGPFTHNTAEFEDSVEALATKVGGGTPLYDAMFNMTDSLILEGHNANKVLVVFTDGQDNESMDYYPGAGLWDAIDHALENNVRVFAVALQTGLDTALISAAIHTGGAVMHTDDAKQMVSYFSALPTLIGGSAQYYKTNWHVQLPNSYSVSGQTVAGTVHVKLPDNSVIDAPFSVTFP